MDEAIAQISELGESGRIELDALRHSFNKAVKNYHDFKLENVLRRDVIIKYIPSVALILVTCAIVEGLMSGMTYIQSGKLSITLSLLFGMGFGLVNIALAFLMGLLCLRRWNYKKHSIISNVTHLKIRIAAKVGTLIFVVCIGELIYAAMLNRTLGGEGLLYEFTSISPWAPFQDAYSQLICAVAVLGSTIAAWEGVVCYDPCPGFRKCYEDNQKPIDDAYEIKDEKIDEIEDIVNKTLKKAGKSPSKWRLCRIKKANTLISHILEKIRRLLALEAEIESKPVKEAPSLANLIIPLPKDRKARAERRLDIAKRQAIHKIELAFIPFQGGLEFSFTSSEEQSHGKTT